MFWGLVSQGLVLMLGCPMWGMIASPLREQVCVLSWVPRGGAYGKILPQPPLPASLQPPSYLPDANRLLKVLFQGEFSHIQLPTQREDEPGPSYRRLGPKPLGLFYLKDTPSPVHSWG